MASGIWTAVSGASAQNRVVESVANNLANADTVAFKKDTPTFKEYLAIVEGEPKAADIPHGPIKDKDFYPLDGKDQAFVVNDATYSNFQQGGLRVTNLPLDLAIEGKGFFEILTPSGIRYTKNGEFKIAPDGKLITREGFPVLAAQPGGLAAQPAVAVQSSQGGLPTQGGVATEQQQQIAARFINLSDVGERVQITESGEVYGGGDLIANLSVVEFLDPRQLRKIGSQNFLNPNPVNISPNPKTAIVRQGALEQSNVNPVEEMTKLINSHRNYELDLKAIKTYDNLMEKEANAIGKL